MSNKLYKYRCFNEFTENIILNSSLYFSPVKNFNDPFDCRLSFKQEYSQNEIQEYFLKMKENEELVPSIEDIIKKFGKSKDFYKFQKKYYNQFVSNIGILSLSKNYKNILMWSHYADNHKGLIFEFETSHKLNSPSSCFLNYLETGPLKIDYKDKYELLSYATDKEILADVIMKLLLTKYSAWEYENEYRVIDTKHQGEKKFRKEELISIIFGANALTPQIERMISLCRNNGFSHVEFKKAKIVLGKFHLEFEDVC